MVEAIKILSGYKNIIKIICPYLLTVTTRKFHFVCGWGKNRFTVVSKRNPEFIGMGFATKAGQIDRHILEIRGNRIPKEYLVTKAW